MEDPVDSLQSTFGFGIDSIVGLVVEFERAAFEDVFGLADVGQRQFRQSWKVHLFDDRPSVFHLRDNRGTKRDNRAGSETERLVAAAGQMTERRTAILTRRTN